MRLEFLPCTVYALCIETKYIFSNQNINFPMGQSRFSYELTFWFISIENGGKQKRTLRVEVNQFCDG